MPLTDTKIKSLKATEKEKLYSDMDKLFLRVRPTGVKSWMFKYKRFDKTTKLGLGNYPDLSLKRARDVAAKYREILANGSDPKEYRDTENRKKEYTFNDAYLEWFELKAHTNSATYVRTLKLRCAKHILPVLGNYPITEIKVTHVLSLLRGVEAQGHYETVKKLRNYISQIFTHSIATGRAIDNPAATLIGVFKTKETKHYPFLKDPKDISELMEKIHSYDGSIITKFALMLIPLLLCRPSELTNAEWSEFDLDKAIWIIPKERMKMSRSHLIPLSNQAVKILKNLKSYTDKGKYLFPQSRNPNKTIPTDTLRLALRRMGYSKEQITTHGFRHMASTILHESNKYDSRIIEMQLSHSDHNKIRAVYNHSEYLEPRKAMMQDYSNMILANGE